jgi:hypothetical protein
LTTRISSSSGLTDNGVAALKKGADRLSRASGAAIAAQLPPSSISFSYTMRLR